MIFYGLISTQSKSSFPLKSISVKTNTCGPIAQNDLQFRYINNGPNAKPTDVKFIFPINASSAVYHLEAKIGSKTIVGKVKEKQQAVKEFKEAVEAGKTAVLAKEAEEASDIMELELGNLDAGESVLIIIKEVYEMTLVKKGTCFRYKFPTSLFVRYSNDGKETVTADTAHKISADSTYHLNFELNEANVSDSDSNSSTSSRSIKEIKQVGKKQPDAFTVGSNFKLDHNKDVFKKDHDIVLDLILNENFKGFKIIDKKDNLLMSSVLLKVPELALADYPAKEFVFLVDCSGSMGGSRITDAAKTLQNLVNALPIGSYFNIYKFGSSFNKLFTKSKLLDSKSKSQAISLCESLSADMGGTELYRCLEEVLNKKREIGQFKRQVFVLTDGGISNEHNTLQMVSDKNDKNRFFSFGIGSGCSTSLVDGLARNGKGIASYCGDNEEENSYYSYRRGGGQSDKKKFKDSGYLEAEDDLSAICMKSIMASAASCISDITAGPDDGLLWPKHDLDAICDSSFLSIFHDLKKLKNLQPEIQFTQTGSDELVSLENCKLEKDIKLIETPFESGVISKLMAKKLITKLLAEYAEMGGYYNRIVSKYVKNESPQDAKEAHKKKIIELSVERNVLSPFTALLAICDDKILDADKMKEKVEAKQEEEIEEFKLESYSFSSKSVAAPRMMKKKSAAKGIRAPPLLCAMAAPPKKSTGIFKSMGGLFGSNQSKSMPIQDSYSAPPPPPSGMIQAFNNSASPMMMRSAGPPPPPPAGVPSMMERKLSMASESSSECSSDLSDSVSMGGLSLEERANSISESMPEQKNTSKSLTNHMQITNSQDPKGHWPKQLPFNHEIYDQEILLNKLQNSEFQKIIPKVENISKDEQEQLINTIYAIILLCLEYNSKCLEWKLVAVKGVSFVRKFISDFDGEFIVERCLSEKLAEKIDYDVFDEIF